MFVLKLEVLVGHLDGPGELVPLSFVVDLLDGDVPLLAPGDGDSWIQVIQFGRTERNLLVLLLQTTTNNPNVTNFSLVELPLIAATINFSLQKFGRKKVVAAHIGSRVLSISYSHTIVILTEILI